MNCPKCKSNILIGEKNCWNCGYKINIRMINKDYFADRDYKSKDGIEESKKKEIKDASVVESDLIQDSVEELKKYLQNVIEADLILKKHIENMNEIDKKRGQKPKYDPPLKPECILPKKKKIDKPLKKYDWNTLMEFVMFGVSCILVFVFGGIKGDHVIFLLFILPALFFLYCAATVPDDANKKYNAALDEYNKKCSVENTRYAEECKKIKEENEAKYQEMFSEYETEYKKQCKEYEDYKNRIEGELHSIKKKLLDKLQALYDKNILHPKYRNLDAVAAIYDYISTGRCEGLEGRDGAYNLYEEKLKQDKEDADREKLVSKIKELETELKNKAEQERINQWLMSNQLSMLKDSLEFESERLRDQYSADISRLLADGQSIF